MHCPARARTGIAWNIEQNLLTRQMIGRRLALRQRACGLYNGDWMALLDLADIAFEVVKSEYQLVIIQAFGPAAELCLLKFLDDQLEPLDLTIAVLNDSFTWTRYPAMSPRARTLSCYSIAQASIRRPSSACRKPLAHLPPVARAGTQLG